MCIKRANKEIWKWNWKHKGDRDETDSRTASLPYVNRSQHAVGQVRCWWWEGVMTSAKCQGACLLHNIISQSHNSHLLQLIIITLVIVSVNKAETTRVHPSHYRQYTLFTDVQRYIHHRPILHCARSGNHARWWLDDRTFSPYYWISVDCLFSVVCEECTCLIGRSDGLCNRIRRIAGIT